MDVVKRYEELKSSLREQLDLVERLKGQKEMLEKSLKDDYGMTVEEAIEALPKMKKKLEVTKKKLSKKLAKVEEALNGDVAEED